MIAYTTPWQRQCVTGSLLTAMSAGGMPPVQGVGVMTARVPSPSAPGPLEGYAARFDDVFVRYKALLTERW
ncbi:hypothetical protein ACIQU6_38240 [Streptomyces sp. NPDC090442]|uniref:hypothetical protein n=1 Tax=Streptomyces sp. NPDC090442 TaxID=3365962 RepID=UPI003827B787